ncbi:EamA family transporter [Flavobacteriaceae bacterium]|nr:EamA family transporter [Flavobacteriaceae bacterium]
MNITRLLAFLSIYLIWGSTYLLNKIAVGQLEPFMLAGVRFLSASFLMFLIVKVSSKSLKVTLVQLKNAAIAGFLFLAIGNGVVVWALSYVDSGLAALTIASQPLIVLLLLWIIDNKRIKLFSWVGVFVGLLGMYLLISQNQITSSPESLKGIIMIIGCVITWGYASIFVGKAELPKNYLVNSAYQMFFGSLWLILMSMIKQEHWISPDEWEINVKWSMLGLIIFGSIVAFTSFNYLLRTVSPEKVATSTYINPIVAMVLGYLVLKETISTQSVVAAVVLLTGVYFINMKRDPRVYLRARAMKRLK